MEKNFIDQILKLMGNEMALKIACNISGQGTIDIERDKDKIERARYFGILKPDTLELTDMGKIFAVKLLLDYADNLTSSGENDEDLEYDFDNEPDDLDEDEDFDDIDWDEDDEDWEDEDEENSDDWVDDDEEDNGDDKRNNFKGKRKK